MHTSYDTIFSHISFSFTFMWHDQFVPSFRSRKKVTEVRRMVHFYLAFLRLQNDVIEQCHLHTELLQINDGMGGEKACLAIFLKELLHIFSWPPGLRLLFLNNKSLSRLHKEMPRCSTQHCLISSQATPSNWKKFLFDSFTLLFTKILQKLSNYQRNPSLHKKSEFNNCQ